MTKQMSRCCRYVPQLLLPPDSDQFRRSIPQATCFPVLFLTFGKVANIVFHAVFPCQTFFGNFIDQFHSVFSCWILQVVFILLFAAFSILYVLLVLFQSISSGVQWLLFVTDSPQTFCVWSCRNIPYIVFTCDGFSFSNILAIK